MNTPQSYGKVFIYQRKSKKNTDRPFTPLCLQNSIIYTNLLYFRWV